jgi:hypothetical protein
MHSGSIIGGRSPGAIDRASHRRRDSVHTIYVTLSIATPSCRGIVDAPSVLCCCCAAHATYVSPSMSQLTKRRRRPRPRRRSSCTSAWTSTTSTSTQVRPARRTVCCEGTPTRIALHALRHC